MKYKYIGSCFTSFIISAINRKKLVFYKNHMMKVVACLEKYIA